MTGFESKRQMSQGKLNEDDMLTIVYAQGFADGKKAQRKPLTQRQVVEGFCKTPHQVQSVAVFDAGVRFAEAAHGIKENT